LESETLAQRVYDQLRERLTSGALSPGTRLVNRTIAAELGTSTIPVREAIGRLVSDGLLELSPHAGAFVRAPEPNELGEIYDVREALEALAASEAARYANDHLLSELRLICEQLGLIAQSIPKKKHATPEQYERWLTLEEEFHLRIVNGSRNRWLVKVVTDFRVIGQVFLAQRASPRLLTRDLAETTVVQHEVFLSILEEHDTVRADSWMREHIRQGREMILRELRSSPSPKSTELRPRKPKST